MLNVLGKDFQAEFLVRFGIASFTQGKTIVFRSGIRSPGCYIDCRKLPSHPVIWQPLMRTAKNFIGEHLSVDTIAGVESGGITHGTALAWDKAMPYVTVRKRQKDHGLPGLIAGEKAVVEGKRVLVVEDMGTTGESAFNAVEALRSAGAIVTDVLFLLTYGFPELTQAAKDHQVNVHAICTFTQILDAAVKLEMIDKPYEELVRSWVQDPHAEWTW